MRSLIAQVILAAALALSGPDEPMWRRDPLWEPAAMLVVGDPVPVIGDRRAG